MGGLQADEVRSGSKPNFVIFINDDHSMVDSQAYGADDIRTPNMQRLASNGIKFTHAFVASPSCGPSRTAMLTGLWPARNGAEPNHRPKNQDVASLPPVLRALGYEVAAIGKVAHADYAKNHGFDYVDGPNKGVTVAADVELFLNARDASKPLCLFVGTRHPHTPWSETTSYDPAKIKLPPTHVDSPETRTMRARYLEDVTNADTLLGEVHKLARSKVAGDTLFACTADHGSAWPFSKWTLYDAGIRVPFIVEWPGHVKPNSTTNAMICWPDLLPTLIEIAGGTVPLGIDGKSFANVLLGKSQVHRDKVFSTHSGDGDFNVYPIRSVRTKEWKYICNLHPEFQQHTHISRSSGPSGREYWQSWLESAKTNPKAAATVSRYIDHPAEELYNLETDPFEQHNLASEPKEANRLLAMRTELDAWLREQGDQRMVFGEPLLLGQPVTTIAPGQQNSSKK